MTLVHDSATRMFWRNVNARSGNAPVNKLGRKPARYDIPEGVPVPSAVDLLGEVTMLPQLHADVPLRISLMGVYLMLLGLCTIETIWAQEECHQKARSSLGKAECASPCPVL